MSNENTEPKDDCLECDLCSESCPITEITQEKNIFRILFGENIDIWNCCSCFRCESVCPQNLSVRNAIFKERRLVNEDELPPTMVGYFYNIIEVGNVYSPQNAINKKRIEMGLPPINFKKIEEQLRKLNVEDEV
jgi:heterodisulfide reductase subunit C